MIFSHPEMKHYLFGINKTYRRKGFPLKSSLIKGSVSPHIYKLNKLFHEWEKNTLGNPLNIEILNFTGQKGTLFLHDERDCFKNQTENSIKESLSFGPVMPESSVENKKTEIINTHCDFNETRALFSCKLSAVAFLPI